MKLHRWSMPLWFLGWIGFSALLAGCVSQQTSGGASGSASNNQADNDQDSDAADGSGGGEGGDGDDAAGGGGGDSADGGGDSDGDMPASDDNSDQAAGANDGEGGLGEDQQETVDVTVDSVEDFGAAMAAIAEAFGIDAETGFTDGCPATTIDGTSVLFDFGDGCNPLAYPEITMSGSISGTIDTEAGTASLALNELSADGTTINGTIDGSYASVDGITTLVADIDLTLSGVASISGTATIEINEQTGEVLVPTASFVVVDAGGVSFALEVTNLHIDPATTASMLPDAGTVVIEVPTGIGTQTIDVTIIFSSQTPVDGTVQVAVGNQDPVTYTPFG